MDTENTVQVLDNREIKQIVRLIKDARSELQYLFVYGPSHGVGSRFIACNGKAVIEIIDSNLDSETDLHGKAISLFDLRKHLAVSKLEADPEWGGPGITMKQVRDQCLYYEDVAWTKSLDNHYVEFDPKLLSFKPIGLNGRHVHLCNKCADADIYWEFGENKMRASHEGRYRFILMLFRGKPE